MRNYDNETDEIFEERFNSLLKKYKKWLEEKMRGRDFYDSVNLLYYKFHKINLKQGVSYIASFDWLTNKKAKINPKSNNLQLL